MTKQAWMFIYIVLGLFVVGGVVVGFLSVGALENRAKPGGVAFGILARETISNVRLDGEPLEPILHWEFDDHPNYNRYGPIHRLAGSITLTWQEGGDNFEAKMVLPRQKPFDYMFTVNLLDEKGRKELERDAGLHVNNFAIASHDDMKVLQVRRNGELVFDHKVKAQRTEELMRQRVRFSPR